MVDGYIVACPCRAIALETVSLGALTVAGPLKLFRGDLGLVARIPIYLDNQTADEVGPCVQYLFVCLLVHGKRLC
jgi:sensor domain CHASE-containing protein